MSEFNQRTALNHQLQLDEAETLLNRYEARRRQKVRRDVAMTRRMVRTAYLNASLVGAGVMAVMVLVMCAVS